MKLSLWAGPGGTTFTASWNFYRLSIGLCFVSYMGQHRGKRASKNNRGCGLGSEKDQTPHEKGQNTKKPKSRESVSEGSCGRNATPFWIPSLGTTRRWLRWVRYRSVKRRLQTTPKCVLQKSLLAGQGGTSFTSSCYLFRVGINATPRIMSGATWWQKSIQKKSQMCPWE